MERGGKQRTMVVGGEEGREARRRSKGKHEKYQRLCAHGLRLSSSSLLLLCLLLFPSSLVAFTMAATTRSESEDLFETPDVPVSGPVVVDRRSLVCSLLLAGWLVANTPRCILGIHHSTQ
jgi:hypothetical protein